MASINLPNLEKRRHVWVARMRVPEDVVPILGKSVFSRSTQQRDPHRAAVVAAPILEGWRAEIAEARQRGTEPDRASIERMDVPTALKVVLMEQQGIRPALFLDHVDGWKAALLQQGTKPRQVDQFARDVKLYGTPATLRLDEATAARTQAWAESRLAPEVGDSLKTVRRRLSAIRGYWGYLQETGRVGKHLACPIVFKAPLSARRTAKAVQRQDKREAFTAAEVVSLWTKAGPETPLADIIALAAFTGGRIEELASIRVDGVTIEAGKPVQVHLCSKTEAGNRQVPLMDHPVLQDIFTRRLGSSKDGFLIPQADNNQYGEKGQGLSKKFGRLKTAEGFPASLVFHSIRKTVAGLLHNVGCPEPIAADILGHKITTMSYGVYSTGTTQDTRRAWLAKATAGYTWP